MELQQEFQQVDVCDIGAEGGVLARLIIGGKKRPELVAETLKEIDVEDFYLPENQIIFSAIQDVYFDTNSLDPVVLRERLNRTRDLDSVGGADEYIIRLVQTATSAADIGYYIEILKRKAKNRKVIQAGEDIHKLSLSLEQPDEKIEQIQQQALALTPLQKKANEYHVAEIAEPSLKSMLEKNSGLPTGFNKLDWHLGGGLQKAELIVVAARPSQGKTAIATDFVLSAAREGKPVAFYSLEMSAHQLTQRMICSIARVDSHKIRHNDLTEQDVTDLKLATKTLSDLQIYILDFSVMTPESFWISLQNLNRRYGISFAVIDYLQLMHVPGKNENRQAEVSKISRGVKAAAKAENMPIVLLSQLNREVEHRISRKPQLSDLRDSGSIEQDADVVILLHRPDWYHRGEDGYEPTHNGVLQIAKSRNGPTGEIELCFSEKFVSFSNVSTASEEGWEDFDKWNS